MRSTIDFLRVELLMALVSWRVLADTVEKDPCQDLAWYREESNHL